MSGLHRRVAAVWILVSAALAILGAWVSGCATGPRGAVMHAVAQGDVAGALASYDRFVELDGPDLELLLPIAGLTLEQAIEEGAGGQTRALRRTAFMHLRYLRRRQSGILPRLAESPNAEVRAHALSLQLGVDPAAGPRLRAMLDAEDEHVRVVAVSSLDPSVAADRGELLRHLTSGPSYVRGAACRALSVGFGTCGATPPRPRRSAATDCGSALEFLDPVSLVAQNDSLPSSRAAAVGALARLGPAAFDVIHGRLADPEATVRLAAARGVLRADPARALPVLLTLLDTPPSRLSIETARLLATGRHDPLPSTTGSDAAVPMGDGELGAVAPDASPGARGASYLAEALVSANVEHRAQAAVALSGVHVLGIDPLLIGRLDEEPVSRVRLMVAATLLRRETTRSRAISALADILEREDPRESMPAVQAAAFLLRGGDARGRQPLQRALVDARPALRRAAAWSLARAGDAGSARGALCDPDPFVRVMAAGGILSATR